MPSPVGFAARGACLLRWGSRHGEHAFSGGVRGTGRAGRLLPTVQCAPAHGPTGPSAYPPAPRRERRAREGFAPEGGRSFFAAATSGFG